jgi:Spondin_N
MFLSRRVGAGAVIAVAGVLALAAPAGADRPAHTFRVTISGLLSGQPFTPPVVAIHNGTNVMFDVGRRASFGIKEIAENGNLAPELSALAADHRVSASLQAPGGPLVPPNTPGAAQFDNSTTFDITADHGAHRLSFAMMLICTNDGFTGANGLELPRRIGASVAARTQAYDSHTEVNTEDLGDLVPPCQDLIGVRSALGLPGTGQSDPVLREQGVISHHTGITGRRDLLPNVHGWDTSKPVAEITIEAIG